ncbi:MAG: hypothetical protein ABR571_10645 [Jatrophihabitans sp.]|uniref:hypothetical protein n=1 Tax=Jatrophihabitans sp. TaxID=1932789 RepID=UPI003911C8C3
MTEPPQPPDAGNGPGEPQYPPPGEWQAPSPPSSGSPHARPTPGGGGPPQDVPPQYQPPQYQPPQYAPQPQYQPGGYPQSGYLATGDPAPAGTSVADRLGARLERRPEPRFGISLAGAGAALVLIGLLIWTVGYLADGFDINFSDNGDVSSNGSSRRFLGAVLFLVLAAVGYTLVVIRRRGPLATAGIVSGAVAVPLVLMFLTFDLGNTVTGGLPFNLDAVYIVSIIVWLGSYLFVPGARGRSFLLGAAAVALPAYIGIKVASHSLGRTAFSATSGHGFNTSGTDSLAAIGLTFGLAYYAIAAFLDKEGRSGAGVAMAYAAFGTTAGGVVAAAPSFKQVGTGIMLIVLGLSLSWYGGRYGRRFTSWAWAVGLVIGIGLLVEKAAPNSYTGAGVMFIVIGAVVAVVAHVVSAATNEEPDIVDARAGTPLT